MAKLVCSSSSARMNVRIEEIGCEDPSCVGMRARLRSWEDLVTQETSCRTVMSRKRFVGGMYGT